MRNLISKTADWLAKIAKDIFTLGVIAIFALFFYNMGHNKAHEDIAEYCNEYEEAQINGYWYNCEYGNWTDGYGIPL